MVATLGSTTYTSVVWTTGDVITEAKLDSMVANDQAYDSHAAQGLLVNNTYSFASKNAAASANWNLIRLNSSNAIEVGEDNVADHTIINAGTSKLVKVKILRQNDTTNAYTKDTVILTGWGQIAAPADTNASETVTFGITFAATPIVVLNFAGAGASGDFTSKGLGSNQYRGYPTGNNISTTAFTAQLVNPDVNWNTAGATTLYYTWIAIGSL